MNNIKMNEIVKGVNLYYIPVKKFKTFTVSINFHRELNKDQVTKNSLLGCVLKRGSKDFNNIKNIAEHLEKLYGASFKTTVDKKGENQIINFTFEGIENIYIEDNINIFEEIIKFATSILLNPLVKENKFKEEYIIQEKTKLRELINSLLNDKMKYAIERCYQKMCENEKFGIYEIGIVEKLDEITSSSLYEHYLDFINNSPIDIFICGNINYEFAIETINKFFNFKPREHKYPTTDIIVDVSDIKYVTEELQVNQGKLSLGFRTKVMPDDKQYYSLVLFNSILGGGPHSKLFNNVREKLSLAYYVLSRIEKFKGLMVVSSGIEIENYDKALKEIKHQLEEIRMGNITENEFTFSVSSLINKIKSLQDNPVAIINYYQSQILSNKIVPFEEAIQNIKDVTLDDIVDVSKQVELDTIYFLKNIDKEVK